MEALQPNTDPVLLEAVRQFDLMNDAQKNSAHATGYLLHLEALRRRGSTDYAKIAELEAKFSIHSAAARAGNQAKVDLDNELERLST
jgi:hypothetical protein